MTTDNRPCAELLAENEELRLRLEEAEETLRAIGSGEVDAFVVSGPEGEQVFTLAGAEHPYRVLVDTMNEGAATLDADGTILYCNNRLATMLQVPLERLVGTHLGSYVASADQPLFAARLGKRAHECDKDEIIMISGVGTPVPTMISCCALDLSDRPGTSVVVTDLTQQKRNEEIVASERLARSIIEQAGEAILVCDEEGRIIQASQLAHQLCGKNPLLKPFDEMFQLRFAETECLFSVLTPLHGECCESVEVELKQKSDQTYYLLLNATPLKSELNSRIGCVVTLTDITERRQAEEALQKAHNELAMQMDERNRELREKEVLLKEIHHRVKNNLQVISSLVSLQADGSKDETVRGVLQDVSYRVRSMALVHEKLYQSKNLAKIDFAEYTRSLLNYLWRAHGNVASSVRLALDMETVSLPVDTAVPCGLILNELAGNALKHAFQGRDEGTVSVSLKNDAEERIHLCVSDNGVGLPEGLVWRQAKSLGLRLVHMLAGQIDANVEVSSVTGTRFEIVFVVRGS